MDLIAHCQVELCANCEAGRTKRPYIECQHIGPDDAGAVIEFVRADLHRGAVEALRQFGAHKGTCAWWIAKGAAPCDCGLFATLDRLGGQ